MQPKNAIWMAIFFIIGIGQPQLFAQEQFPHVEGDILIRIKDKHEAHWVLQDLSLYKGLSTQLQIRELLSDHLNIWRFTFNNDNVSHDAMLRMVRNHPSVHNAQLNYILEKRATPNDPSYGQQWQYEQTSDFDLDASAAWDITTGGVTALGDTIVVCVIDDGLEISHSDWGNNVWYNHGEIPGNNIDDDGNGYIDDFRGWNANANNNNIVASGFSTHGTPVSGIIAAKGNNGIGVSGVNWDVKLMFVVGGGTSANSIAAYSYPLSCRKLYNQTNGAKGAFVVATNASWGQNNQQCATYAPLVNEFYDTLGVYGILNAAATANANTNVDVQGDFPTSCTSDYLIAVTNMNQLGNKVTQAGYGSTHIDLGAYGEGTYTIRTSNGYAAFGGTSAATPHVAGTIGLLYSAPCPRLAQMARTQPAQTALLLKQIILNSTVANTNIQSNTLSGGVLNMKNALDSVMAIGCSLSGCHEPYNTLVVNKTGTTAVLNWDRVDATTVYYVRYKEVGAGTWVNASVTDTFVNISSLMACTSYEVEVSSNCDSANYSLPFTFKTGDCCNAPNAITTVTADLTTASFSWSTDPFVTTYNVEYKLKSASTWQTTTSSNGSIALTGLDSCAEYELRIISTCPVNVNNLYSPIIEFETEGCGKCTSPNYCASVGTTSTDDWLENISLNTINNTTGNDGGFASFVNSGPSTDLAQGGSYPISIDIGYNTGPWATNWRLKVWIDYNQDEAFDDATELAYDAGQISSAITTHSGVVNIPANATLSRTRMRVAMKWGTTALNPCATSSFGETEDYCVNIVEPTTVSTIEQTVSTALNIYPNPFDNHLTVSLNSPQNQAALILLQTIAGQEIINMSQKLAAGENSFRLPSSTLPQGMYLVVVQLENGTTLTQKVIRQ